MSACKSQSIFEYRPIKKQYLIDFYKHPLIQKLFWPIMHWGKTGYASEILGKSAVRNYGGIGNYKGLVAWDKIPSWKMFFSFGPIFFKPPWSLLEVTLVTIFVLESESKHKQLEHLAGSADNALTSCLKIFHLILAQRLLFLSISICFIIWNLDVSSRKLTNPPPWWGHDFLPQQINLNCISARGCTYVNVSKGT